MKRQIQGLSSPITPDLPDGRYLVRVQRAQYRWHKQKPSYELTLYVLEPKEVFGGSIVARLSYSPKVLWMLAWFLRDFRYSRELLERDEIDTRALVGLEGVVHISHEIACGRSTTKLEAFATAADWEFLTIIPKNPEVA